MVWVCQIWAWDFHLNRTAGLWGVETDGVLPLLKTQGQRDWKDGCFSAREYQVELGIITKHSLNMLIMVRLYFEPRNVTSKSTFYNIYRWETMSTIFFNVIWERKIGIKLGWGNTGQEWSGLMGLITLLGLHSWGKKVFEKEAEGWRNGSEVKCSLCEHED